VAWYSNGLMTDHTPQNARHHSGKIDLRTVARRVMIERGLVPDFSNVALDETAALVKAGAAPSAPTEALKDMRQLLWASIDNDDSRDLDQLSVAEALADGAVKIFVAIADVDALVKKDSAIDGHARTNTTSVYTAAQIFPMLPEQLSTDLTSLGEGVDRQAMVVEIVVRADGSIADSDVYRALVRNHAKLAYNGVAAWLDGSAPAPAPVLAVPGIDEQLRLQDRVAQRLRKLRFEHGALTLETLEARAVFDGGGTVSDLVPEGRNRAKDLIEDFMIAANGVTARFLDSKGFPSLRRVLRSPERWAKIVALAESAGETLQAEPSNEALEAFLMKRRAAEPTHFADLSLSVVKLLGRGEYVLDLPGRTAIGHFGLALKDYTHSTAPNRRFPDLITQRLLKAALSGHAAPYSSDELNALAVHCTEQEDNATKVERRVRKSVAALLLSSRVGQEFDAIVTGASPNGTWVRIAHPAAEGKVVRGDHGLDVGDRVRITLVATDFERGFVDFARA
jgi:VacB/RNase II family 3'-5' exoribonuclease